MKRVLLWLFILFLTQTGFGQQGGIPDSVRNTLDTVYYYDQQYRSQLESYVSLYGWGSKELSQLLNNMEMADSVNIKVVSSVLDQYGWLGPNEVGENGSLALFLVIQHAKVDVQEKYLPLLQKAVRERKAKPSQMAMLEDRVLLYHGKRQVYGTQVALNMKTNQYYVLPMMDPKYLDLRRRAVGLPPMAEYLATWKLEWNVEKYMEELPGILLLHPEIKE
ncbi:hypothetical protein KJS94_00975 [Flavihumibacter rivuli]|uniref:DUF6624 domain-containing protein n=1 Tax=Flavihumibacter rivuli TaxID=2838156 RepID=UPI001BDF371C|nr:DUF6624 domain-containing protein [Flavihumibacter rivuli]ULQ56767.1 hypothetical protein KJS94_00975 [Flavihumibacter rivuli]